MGKLHYFLIKDLSPHIDVLFVIDTKKRITRITKITEGSGFKHLSDCLLLSAYNLGYEIVQ
jgi:hypothetical protein